MTTSDMTRRKLLQLAVGAGQVALLDKLGFPVFRSRSARANPNGGTGTGNPTKLLTIYVPGGWFPVYLWCPLSDAEIGLRRLGDECRDGPLSYTAFRLRHSALV